ncbi:MAG: hypothetical protein AAF228_05335 [Pseudomonadota bacterium]
MDSVLIILPWLVILAALGVAFRDTMFSKKREKVASPTSDKTYTTRIRLQQEDGQPYKDKDVSIAFSKIDADGFSPSIAEELTTTTNINGIAVFEHKTVGFATMHLTTVQHKIRFSAPNDIGFVVTKSGGQHRQVNFYN